MRSRKIKINGLKLQCYSWGSPRKPPLFLFHGWLDTGAGFHFLCEHLQDRFFCIAPDLRGYGRSEHVKSPLGYFFYEYVADAHEIFKALSPRRPFSILGHSLGGAMLSIYAGTYPGRVKNFINVEGFGFQGLGLKPPPVRALEWLEGLGKKEFKVYRNFDSFVRRLRQNYPRLREDRAKFLAKYLSVKKGGRVQMAADPKHKVLEPYPFPMENFYSFWRNTRARTLFVSGDQTELAKYYPKGKYKEELRRRRRYFPAGCKRVSIKGAGHMVHHERPEELAKMVSDFLS